MFKNLMIYCITAGWTMELDAMEAALAAMLFTPCEGAQEKSYGWLPARGQGHGALVESINGQRILRFAIESKSVPASVIKRDLDARAAYIEANEGRKPGRIELRELRDDVHRALLPHAFPKTTHVLVWLDLKNNRLVLDTTSQTKADEVISALVKCLPAGLQISALNTQVAPQAAMTQWLTDVDSLPHHFAPGRHVELHSMDEMQSVVKFDRHHLDDDQMRLHIGQGKLPTKLAMDWDGRVSFVLTDGTQLKRVTFLEGVFKDQPDDQEGGFDTDVVIATGELTGLINDLTEALGGVLV